MVPLVFVAPHLCIFGGIISPPLLVILPPVYAETPIYHRYLHYSPYDFCVVGY